MTSRKKAKIVSLGGGTGLPVVLKALENLGERIAVVNMVDDGRSSGILKKRYGIPPVGDLRNSLAAMARNRELAEVFNFRFEYGPLYPHPVGNIVLAAHFITSKGEINESVRFFSSLLRVDGKVFPACNEIVELVAETRNGRIVRGQVNVSHTRGIRKVWLEPQVDANREVIRELMSCDYIVIAPGSLYSSIIPVLITGEIGKCLTDSPAKKIWIFNVANERNETFMYGSKDYVEAMKRHVRGFHVDYLLFSRPPKKFTNPHRLVKLNMKELESVSRNVIIGDFVDGSDPHIHDYRKLRKVLKQIILGRKN